jgi:hypothetical protein
MYDSSTFNLQNNILDYYGNNGYAFVAFIDDVMIRRVYNEGSS